MSIRWPVERKWLINDKNSDFRSVGTNELASRRACGLLGAAGLGKSFELAYIAEAGRSSGRSIELHRFAELGVTQDQLEAQLNRICRTSTNDTLILLDALDEVMIPIRTAALIVRRWILDKVSVNRPGVHITCRSAVWPQDVGNALREVYDDEFAIAQLQTLDDDDIKAAAKKYELDGNDFLAQVGVAHARSLAQQPLTLEMLLKTFQAKKHLPRSRDELFREGMQILADERMERYEIGTNSGTSTSSIISAAERVACFTLLSGREAIDLNDSPNASAIGRRELDHLPGNPPLGFDILRDIGRSGLCEGNDSFRFRFAHRQFAEYLAGRRIASLLPHQAKALLATSLGEQGGVAGPLRETAAFAAMSSPAIAEWITDTDPEIIGLSDVANSDLRRRATLKMFAKFRAHELTDSQVGRSVIELRGFEYPNASADLKPVLLERREGSEDILEFAIELIESWNLIELADDLADLTLDSAAPIHVRRTAGYALAKFNKPDVAKRLFPLIAGVPEDQNLDLKGIALRCNWPANLSVVQLLTALTPPPADNHSGAYDGFLGELERAGFDAREELLTGLAWAKRFVEQRERFGRGSRLAFRIATAALERIGEAGVCEALADLLIAAEDNNIHSPLVQDRVDESDAGREPYLSRMPDQRRELLQTIVKRQAGKQSSIAVVDETPGLICSQDSRWLLEKATQEDLPMPEREHFARLARFYPKDDPDAWFADWYAVRNVEPISTYCGMRLSVDLGSVEAEQEKKEYQRSKRLARTRKRVKGRAAPETLQEILTLCESKDPRYFIRACYKFENDEANAYTRSERFISRTAGWNAAERAIKARTLAAASAFLRADLDDPQTIRGVSYNAVYNGPMEAMWLLLECERRTLEAFPPEWWAKWCWYILHQSQFGLSDEPDEPKAELFSLLHQRAAESIHTEIEQLLGTHEENAARLLSRILDSLVNIDDSQLDEKICRWIQNGKVSVENIGSAAEFVLARKHEPSLSTCLRFADPSSQLGGDDRTTIEVLGALLQKDIARSWPLVFEFLKSRIDLAREVLRKFVDERWRRRSDDDKDYFLADLSYGQVGQLVLLIFQAFPFDETSFVRGDEIERLRNQLINWLSDQRDFGAVQALRDLEKGLGQDHPWLRRPRASAERNYRLSIWSPVLPKSVAEILSAADKRLIRSSEDVADGIVSALESFANSLRHGNPNSLENFWNTSTKSSPTPKAEERASELIHSEIEDYFKRFAVTADREVRVYRRKQSAAKEGAPSSEVDLLCRVSATGTMAPDPIAVPIEVKLAHNSEARSGIRDQLLERYMNELGAGVGVYVVVWMGNIDSPFRPLWPTVEAAKEDLASIVDSLTNDGEDCSMRVVVIDASLPTPRSKKSAKKRAAGKTRPKKVAINPSQSLPKKRNSKGTKPTAKKKPRPKGRVSKGKSTRLTQAKKPRKKSTRKPGRTARKKRRS